MTYEGQDKGSHTSDLVEEIKEVLDVIEDDEIIPKIREIIDLAWRYEGLMD